MTSVIDCGGFCVLCAQAELECGLTLSCGSLPVRDCTAAMEEGFFVLKDDQVHETHTYR